MTSEPKRVLAVDDELQNLELLEALLETFGYEPVLAADGFEALAKMSTGIALVLLDVMMPGIDGFEVLRQIRNDPRYFDIPVIMVTSLAGKTDRLHAAELGANDFISKPIDRVELRVRMKSLLKMKEAQDAIKRHGAELEIMVEKRTEALRQSEQKYRALFEDSLDPILMIDQHGTIVDVNQAFEGLFGYPARKASVCTCAACMRISLMETGSGKRSFGRGSSRTARSGSASRTGRNGIACSPHPRVAVWTRKS